MAKKIGKFELPELKENMEKLAAWTEAIVLKCHRAGDPSSGVELYNTDEFYNVVKKYLEIIDEWPDSLSKILWTKTITTIVEHIEKMVTYAKVIDEDKLRFYKCASRYRK